MDFETFCLSRLLIKPPDLPGATAIDVNDLPRIFVMEGWGEWDFSVGLFVGLFFVFRYLLVGEFSFSSVGMGQLIKGIIYPFIYSAGIALAYLIMSSAENKVERQRIWVIYIVSFFNRRLYQPAGILDSGYGFCSINLAGTKISGC